MGFLTDSSTWETGIYRLETTDQVLGGAETNPSNIQALQLARRTTWLKNAVAIAGLSPTATAASIRLALGIALGSDAQPYDADLAAIASLTTTPYGRSLLTLANIAAAQSYLGLTPGTDVQPYDSDLAAIATLSTTAFGRGLLALVDAAALRTAAGLVLGTDVQAYDSDLAAIAALTTQTFGRSLLTQPDAATARATLGSLVSAATCEGRLTLATAMPVTTGDVTAATTLYFTPHIGNLIAIWDGTNWVYRTFSEISLGLAGATANTNFDIFIYDNAGTLALERVAWTNDTTRASAISRRDGVWVKSSDNRRLLGTIRTTSVAGQTEDSATKSFVSNVCNRVPKKLKRVDPAASWTCNVTSLRPTNNNTLNRVEIVSSTNGNLIDLQYHQSSAYGTFNYRIGIGINSTTATSSDTAPHFINTPFGATALKVSPADGYNYFQMLETTTDGVVVNLIGNNSAPLISGMTGTIWA